MSPSGEEVKHLHPCCLMLVVDTYDQKQRKKGRSKGRNPAKIFRETIRPLLLWGRTVYSVNTVILFFFREVGTVMLARSVFGKRPTVITLSLPQTQYPFCPELSLFSSRHITHHSGGAGNTSLCVNHARTRVCVGVWVHLFACCSFNSLPRPHTPVAGLDYHLNSKTKNSATSLAPRQFLHPLSSAAKHPLPTSTFLLVSVPFSLATYVIQRMCSIDQTSTRKKEGCVGGGFITSYMVRFTASSQVKWGSYFEFRSYLIC